ncbi:MAG: enoyl-CoA hydratase/isomerase family protein [Alphaproteobacteria bacterium]|nr:enoyl-CoA hydratase/isomerase family protein [Alphaproteobacteria bacterium]
MAVVETRKQDRIFYVTLNRPEAKNAINKEVHLALCDAWGAFQNDDALDVAILTGTGDAFCAGMDLKAFVPEYVGATPQMIADWIKLGLGGLPRGYHWLDKPVIGAVNGWSLAGGFELAMACDIRIASDQAKFGSFEARRGFHHGDGGIARLVNFCGVAVALEMLLTAEPIDAQRAQQINLVSKVVPHDQLMAEAEQTASYILRNDQASVRSAKRTILDMIGRRLDDQLKIEALAGYTLMADGRDVTERLQRFYDKSDRGRHGTHATPL